MGVARKNSEAFYLLTSGSVPKDLSTTPLATTWEWALDSGPGVGTFLDVWAHVFTIGEDLSSRLGKNGKAFVYSKNPHLVVSKSVTKMFLNESYNLVNKMVEMETRAGRPITPRTLEALEIIRDLDSARLNDGKKISDAKNESLVLSNVRFIKSKVRKAKAAADPASTILASSKRGVWWIYDAVASYYFYRGIMDLYEWPILPRFKLALTDYSMYHAYRTASFGMDIETMQKNMVNKVMNEVSGLLDIALLLGLEPNGRIPSAVRD